MAAKESVNLANQTVTVITHCDDLLLQTEQPNQGEEDPGVLVQPDTVIPAADSSMAEVMTLLISVIGESAAGIVVLGCTSIPCSSCQ